MELAVRKGPDRFVTPGAYRALEARLRAHAAEFAEMPTAVVSAFDRRARMLPFLFYDSHMFPAGAGAIAAALYRAGAPGATAREPMLVDTGLQRLVQDLDELPGESTMLGLLEPPHWGVGLSAAPLAAARVRRNATIVNLLVTQGCKFNCAYCPIPAAGDGDAALPKENGEC